MTHSEAACLTGLSSSGRNKENVSYRTLHSQLQNQLPKSEMTQIL